MAGLSVVQKSSSYFWDGGCATPPCQDISNHPISVDKMFEPVCSSNESGPENIAIANCGENTGSHRLNHTS